MRVFLDNLTESSVAAFKVDKVVDCALIGEHLFVLAEEGRRVRCLGNFKALLETHRVHE